jgi:hypothetical protein
MRTGFLPAVALAAATALGAAAPAPPTPTEAELARLTLQNELLKKQLDLAKAKEFYLVLDPQAQTLTLMYHAAPPGSTGGGARGRPPASSTKRATFRMGGCIWRRAPDPLARSIVEVRAPPTDEGTEAEARPADT